MVAPVSPDPVHVELEGDPPIARWRPFVHWLLVIPHMIVVWALGIVQQVLSLIAFFAVLFTKQVPDTIFDTIVMTRRYEWRATSYFLCTREVYPPFDFTPSAQDPGTDPARLSVDRPVELNRWLPLVKWLLVIPHLIVLVVLAIAAVFAALAGYVGVVVTGRYPAGIRDFLVGVYRWNTRVQAYAFNFLTDRYPPFSLT